MHTWSASASELGSVADKGCEWYIVYIYIYIHMYYIYIYMYDKAIYNFKHSITTRRCNLI